MSYFVTILLFVNAVVNLSSVRSDKDFTSYVLPNTIVGVLYMSAAIWCSFNVWGM